MELIKMEESEMFMILLTKEELGMLRAGTGGDSAELRRRARKHSWPMPANLLEALTEFRSAANELLLPPASDLDDDIPF